MERALPRTLEGQRWDSGLVQARRTQSMSIRLPHSQQARSGRRVLGRGRAEVDTCTVDRSMACKGNPLKICAARALTRRRAYSPPSTFLHSPQATQMGQSPF